MPSTTSPSRRCAAVRDLRLRLWRADRLPAGAETPRAHHRHRLAERERLRGGPGQGLEPDPDVLEGTDGRSPRRAPWVPDARGNEVPVPERCSGPSRVAPESYTLNQALLERPGQAEIQLDLFLDYASNVALYPKVQAILRTHRPPLLAIWGKHDPFFVPAGPATGATIRAPRSASWRPGTSPSRRIPGKWPGACWSSSTGRCAETAAPWRWTAPGAARWSPGHGGWPSPWVAHSRSWWSSSSATACCRPRTEGEKDRLQAPSERGRAVLDPRRHLAKDLPADQPVVLHLPELLDQQPLADLRPGPGELESRRGPSKSRYSSTAFHRPEMTLSARSAGQGGRSFIGLPC